MNLFAGRKKPYTDRGIRRCLCERCGERAQYQWSACSNGNWWIPLCAKCDILVNAMLLRWMRHPHKKVLMQKYRRRVASET